MRRTTTAIGTAAALVTSVLTAGGVVGHAATRPGPEPVPSDVAGVDWGACDLPDLPDVPVTYQCATYDVPLDHADPAGPSIELALIRRPADDPDARRGSLFVNFGGPGADAVSSVALVGDSLFDPAVTAELDLIGMDPRGVGRSTPLQCVGPDDDVLDYFTSFVWPEGARDLRTVRDVNAALDARCVADGGPVRDHMSTTAVADDLDLLRRAVGDEHLTYVGYSYGSYLGAMYANRYPDRVGALVVDAVVDPVDWTTGRDVDGTQVPVFARMDSDDGAQATFEEFLRLCDEAGPERCAFSGEGGTSASARFDALHERLRAEPVLDPTTGLLVDHQIMTAQTRAGLNSPATWQPTAQDLARYEQLASRAPAATRLDVSGPSGRRGATALPPQVLAREQLSAVVCSDSVTPDRVSAWQRAEVSRGGRLLRTVVDLGGRPGVHVVVGRGRRPLPGPLGRRHRQPRPDREPEVRPGHRLLGSARPARRAAVVAAADGGGLGPQQHRPVGLRGRGDDGVPADAAGSGGGRGLPAGRRPVPHRSAGPGVGRGPRHVVAGGAPGGRPGRHRLSLRSDAGVAQGVAGPRPTSSTEGTALTWTRRHGLHWSESGSGTRLAERTRRAPMEHPLRLRGEVLP